MEWSMAWLMLLGMGIFHGINPGMGWLFAVGLGLQERRRSAVWTALLPLALGHALAVGVAILIFGLIGSVIPAGVLKWGVAVVLLGFGVYKLFRSNHPRYGGMQVGVRELTVWSFLMATAHGAGLMVLPFVFGVSMVGADVSTTVHGQDMTAMHDHVTTAVHDPNAKAMHDHNAKAMHDHNAKAMHDHAPKAVHDHDGMNHAVQPMPAADPRVFVSSAGSSSAHAAHAATMTAMLPNEPIVGVLATLVHTMGYLLVMGLAAVLVYEKLGLRMLRRAWVNLDVIWAAALILTAILTPLL